MRSSVVSGLPIARPSILALLTTAQPSEREPMRLPQTIYDRMLAHARSQAPNECCGIIGARGQDVVTIMEIGNTAERPQTSYQMHVHEQYVALTLLRDAGLRLGAIYHSHTQGEPVPSPGDIRVWAHPYALCIIIGLADSVPDVHAYTIRKGRVNERQFYVLR